MDFNIFSKDKLKKAVEGIDLNDAFENPQDYKIENGIVVKREENVNGKEFTKKMNKDSWRKTTISIVIIILLLLVMVTYIIKRIGG